MALVLGLGCGPAATGESAEAGETGTPGSTTSDAPTSSTTEPGTTAGTSVGTSIGTSAEETTTSDDESSSSASVGFLVDPDGGGTACFATSYCDVWGQDCPEGEKCIAWSADGDHDLAGCVLTRCAVLAPDPVPPGGTCTVEVGPWSGLDDCDVGAYCWGVDPVTLEGLCISNCGGSEANPVCPDELECFIGYGGWITACVRGCDALVPTCGDAATCTTTDGDPSVCLPSSFGVATGQAVGCDHTVGCGEGFACVATDRVAGCEDPSSCCTALCDPEAPTCDVATPVCTPLAGAETVGACTLE